MADRYFHVDVSFMHKKTADRLYEKFGYAGPLVFLALCAQAKNGRPPGTFQYENEPLGWVYLGFAGREPDFTLDEFFRATGQLKQTVKRRQTHGNHVVLSQYGRWQKDAKRLQAAERQRRHRQGLRELDMRDSSVTASVTQALPRTRTRTRAIATPRDNEIKTSYCTEGCGTLPPGISLQDHLRITHGLDV